MTRPKRVYKANLTGRVWNTEKEAILDNRQYSTDVNYRMNVKAGNYGTVSPTINYHIPFIPDKKIVLTNAGLASGAVLSENMLDSIANHAINVGLPVKTAIGLAVKESTLGNWTDDGTFHKLFKKNSANYDVYKNLYNTKGTIQHINPGVDISERALVNFHDERNPYIEAINYADKEANKAVSDIEWNNNLETALNKHQKRYIDILAKGEKYADNQANKIKNIPKIHVLDAAFSKFKNNPNNYNPGQINYVQLVNKRADDVWKSPEVQQWYRRYLDSTIPKYKQGGWVKNKLYNFLSNTGGINAINGGDYTGSYIYGNKPDTIPGIIYTDATLYGGKNADKTRNPLALYLGLDTIGLNKLRHDKYVLGKDTLDVDVFDGKILPIKRDKTPYKLNNKLKQEFDNLIENDKTFLINTNNYPIDSIYNKQTLDNTRSARVKPIRDKNGKYSMKLTKLWDLGGSVPGGYIADYINKFAGGKPFVLEQIMPVEFVDEYTKENYHLRQAREKVGKQYKNGGSIYIKPSHRGRLTELKARTGKSEAELYSDGNPAHKKMVVFARNARRWNK